MTDQVVGFILATTAVLGAAGYLAKKIRTAVHALDAIERVVKGAADRADDTGAIVERELAPNHGGSMKDDVSSIAYVVGNLWRQVEDIDNRLTDHLDRKKP